jgi:hypothetical protein
VAIKKLLHMVRNLSQIRLCGRLNKSLLYFRGERQEGGDMGKINSRQKGAAGERELSSKLKEYGYDTRRGQQYCGIGQADVIGVKGIHLEIKRQERVQDEQWLKQSERDAKNEIPVVMYRRNHEQWKILIRQNIADLIWQTLTDEQKDYIIKSL